MFDLNDAYKEITLDDIVAKVSEYTIWKTYCTNFEELGKSFLSELYTDSRPSCRIYLTPENTMLYKDFGTNECYNWLGYIKQKYGCTTNEAINIIANDFNIRPIKHDIEPKLVLGHLDLNKARKVSKSTIEILSQPWTIQDYEYWNQYHIPLKLLEEYNVFSTKHAYLNKGDKTTIFNYSKTNPIYSYRFESFGKYTYKVYMPYANKGYRWFFSGTANDIEGYDQLPLGGETLILTKSLKDCMCYRLIGLPAISLQGEANKLNNDIVEKLLKRFDKIIVNYDNDKQGINSVEGYYSKLGTFVPGIKQKYNFDYFYIDEAKDLSDYIKQYGLDKAKEMIDGKINRVRV